MWCVAELDEEYIRRMEDILVIYEKPLSECEPVVCVDEKPSQGENGDPSPAIVTQ